jgi:hypothetical protein
MLYSMATTDDRTGIEKDVVETVVAPFNCYCTQDRGKRLVISLDMILRTRSETYSTGSKFQTATTMTQSQLQILYLQN